MSDEITLGNISSLSSPATDLIARAAGPLIEGDYFFRELINALPAAVYTTDPYGRITYYNEAAAALDATLKAFPELMTYCIKLRRRNCDDK